MSDRDLYETYLPAFRTLIKEGNAWSVMCAYNQFREYPCCANPMLNKILRKDWGFKGYVVSDCWAISDFYNYQNFSEDAAAASAVAVKNGTDLNCGNSYPHLAEAIDKGLISEEVIDVAVKRLYMARFKLGMFDPEEIVPYAQIPVTVNTSGKHAQISLEAAQKSIVLLKNGNNVLPLSKNIKKLAVIGPNADNWEALIGNYNGIPKQPVTVLQGIKEKLKNSEILFAEGSPLAEGISNLKPIPEEYLVTGEGEPGVVGAYYANDQLEGEPLFTRIDKNIDFYWESASPSPGLPDDDFSVRWMGFIVPPVSGYYSLGAWGMPTYDLWLEGEQIISHNSEHHAFYKEKMIRLEAGKKYKFVYEYKNWYGDGDARLLWSLPDVDMQKKAVEMARQADAVVMVLGLSQRLEGEEMPIQVDGFSGGDRTHLELPKVQRELMMAVEKTGNPVIVVLLNGSALSVNWAAENVDGLIIAGYPGQEGGHAVADVLFGDYNPAGRLPVTYYKSVDQLPPFEAYDMEGRTYRYFTEEPLYPFGYGLSYTTFKYTNLEMPSAVIAGEPVRLQVTVTNTGSKTGDEVVQLYLKDEEATTLRPITQLEGFKRINLKSGESKILNFELDSRQFSMINNNNERVIEPGWFSVSLGGGQPGAKGSVYITGRVQLTGEVVKMEK